MIVSYNSLQAYREITDLFHVLLLLPHILVEIEYRNGGQSDDGGGYDDRIVAERSPDEEGRRRLELKEAQVPAFLPGSEPAWGPQLERAPEEFTPQQPELGRRVQSSSGDQSQALRLCC